MRARWAFVLGSGLIAWLAVSTLEGAARRMEQTMTLATRVEAKDWRVVREMRGASPDAVSAIARLARHADREVRVLALECLDEVGGAVARGAFLAALTDRDEDVRDRAVRGLEHHAGRADVASLLGTVRSHADEFVRERLALIVGRVADRSAIPVLQEILAAGAPADVAAALALALARLGDAASRARVLDRLEAPDVEARRAAIADFVYVADAAEAARLLPLVDDTREARPVGRLAGYSLRVCDLAIDALGLVLGPGALPFETNVFRRYSAEERLAARRALVP